MKSKEMLDERIKKLIEYIDKLPEGSDEKIKALENLKTLYEIRMNETKADQTKSDTVIKWVSAIGQIGLGVVSIVAYDRWYKRGLIFEEEGTIRSPMTRNLLSRMLPGKK